MNESDAEEDAKFGRCDLQTLEELEHRMKGQKSLSGWSLRDLSLKGVEFGDNDVHGLFLLGCEFETEEQKLELIRRGAVVFPSIEGLPYNPYRNQLYTTEELLRGWEHGGYTKTVDFEIYAYFDRYTDANRRAPVYYEMAQRLHDHAIDLALNRFLEEHRGKGVVGIMGGHNARRDADYYREVSLITWELKREGYMIASGGGPGVMEAANLGAYLAPYREESVIDAALEMLKAIPTFAHARSETINAYVDSARGVVKRFGKPSDEEGRRYGYEEGVCRRSLAVPTWFYGHEPTNLFSDDIAKYFANSIREDGLLAICDAGVIYAPGGAGTMQEVFIDLSQNHYAMGGKRSPMCFLTAQEFRKMFELINDFIKKRDQERVYGDMIAIVETWKEAVEFIKRTPYRRVEG